MNNMKEIEIEIPENNVIKSDNHTLITEYIDEIREPVYDENDTMIEGLFEIIPGYNKHKLFIGDFVDNTFHGWNQIKNRLMSCPNNDFLECHISSYGGSTVEGIELYNIVNTKFHDAQVYLNYGYSMGALAFLYFNDRNIYEHSEIMFHSWSGGFYGKAQDIEDHLNHSSNHLKGFFTKLLSPYFTKKEVKKILKGKEVWIGSYEMLQRGIATGIIKDGEFYTAEKYLQKFKKNGSIRKSYKEQEENDDSINN